MKMTNRDWALVVLENIIKDSINLIEISRIIPDEDFEIFLHTHYDELGVNIFKNLQFMRMIITRNQLIEGEMERFRMTNDDLIRYIYKNKEDLVSEFFKSDTQLKFLTTN